jgi:hypothetical protein
MLHRLQLWKIEKLDSSTFTSTHTFLAAITGFGFPDDRMPVQSQVNFSKYLLLANFNAIPAGFTMPGI